MEKLLSEMIEMGRFAESFGRFCDIGSNNADDISKFIAVTQIELDKINKEFEEFKLKHNKLSNEEI